LNRHLFREIGVLKFSFLALRKAAPEAEAGGLELARLVAPMHKGNGKLITRGCAADGTLHDYELLTRRLTRAECDGLLAVERGALVRWRQPRLLGDGRTVRGEEMGWPTDAPVTSPEPPLPPPPGGGA
jgi:hypothetical protein